MTDPAGVPGPYQTAATAEEDVPPPGRVICLSCIWLSCSAISWLLRDGFALTRFRDKVICPCGLNEPTHQSSKSTLRAKARPGWEASCDASPPTIDLTMWRGTALACEQGKRRDRDDVQ